MTSIDTFHCPACHASLDLETANGPSVVCPYCNTTVIVPDALRQSQPAAVPHASHSQPVAEIARLLANNQKIAAIKLYRETFGSGLKEAKEAVEAMERGEAVAPGVPVSVTAPTGRSSTAGCSLVAIVVILVAGAFFAYWYLSGRQAEGEGNLPEVVLAEPLATAASSLSPAEPASSLETVLTIGGEEGTGPGFFKDTRWLGVDGEGQIYTGDFEGGRVQVFDSSGAFVRQWFTQGGPYLSSMVVDREGTVSTIESGKIYRYNGSTGETLGNWQAADVFLFDDLALSAEGRLLALGDGALVAFENDGTPARVVPDLLERLPSDANTASIRDMAVDGANNLYLLFTFDDAIYKFDHAGDYLDRFQQPEGSTPAPSYNAIAVNGQGYIFVEDFSGILVLDDRGQEVDRIDLPGVAFSLLFDTQNHLYRMDRNGNQVQKFAWLSPAD